MITSPHNPKIQLVRALLGKPRQRNEEKSFIIEGVRLAEEALKAGVSPRLVLYSPALSLRGQEIVDGFAAGGADVEVISDQILQFLSLTETSQGLIAVLPLLSLALPEQLNFAIIADALRDPGNLGALLRTAAAAGAQAILLGPGTTDPYGPKVVRAGMGAHFHLPIRSMNWPEMHMLLKKGNPPLHIFLADVAQGEACWQADLCQPCALLVGGEAEGASEAGRQMADSSIHIPMPGQSESLNAAIAAAVLIFEVVRQRASIRSLR